jgi:ubiquinone biosynthesis protein
MLASIRHSARIFTIAWTLARHDALFGLEALHVSPFATFLCKRIALRKHSKLRRGVRLARALEALGPTFIKAGQTFSTRPDLIGEDIAADLAVLRDQLPPFDSKEAVRIIEAELESSIHTLYTEFDKTPVAAASIAQVHFAKTPDGREVAVKILRPNIEDAFARDIALMVWIAGIVVRRLPEWSKRLKPFEVVAMFQRTVALELDLRYEAAAASELRENTKNDGGFYVPEIDWQRTARRVLTQERVYGISVGDVDAVKAAHPDTTRIVEIAASAFFNQVFRDGFFHADMHPGNLFVRADGSLAVVDFGIMGRVDHESQMFLAEILWGFLREDYQHVAQVHVDYGYCPRHVDVHQLAQACRAIGKPILGKPLNEISVGRLLGQLLQVAETFEMEAQPHLLLLQRTMMTAEGVGRSLNPNVNMWKLSEPLIAEWAKRNLSARARVKNTMQEGAQALQNLPRLLRDTQRFFARIEAGGIPVAPESLDRLSYQRMRSQRPWLWFAWASWLAIVVLIAVEVYKNFTL